MTHSVLAAPLAAERGPIGVLQVVNRIGGGTFSDDDLAFLEALAGSVAVAVENARLLAETRAQLVALQRATEEHAALEALRRELDIAREIQQSILPRRFPDRDQIDLFATMLPARDVGGDFYDFFALDDRRFGLVIGDVSGKGMPAALFMAVCRTLVKATALSGLGPAACLQRVNTLLLTDNPSDMFVTLFYAIFDLRSGEVTYSNGGHNPPFVIRPDAAVETLAVGGALLGVLDSPQFSEHRLRVVCRRHAAAVHRRGDRSGEFRRSPLRRGAGCRLPGGRRRRQLRAARARADRRCGAAQRGDRAERRHHAAGDALSRIVMTAEYRLRGVSGRSRHGASRHLRFQRSDTRCRRT